MSPLSIQQPTSPHTARGRRPLQTPATKLPAPRSTTPTIAANNKNLELKVHSVLSGTISSARVFSACKKRRLICYTAGTVIVLRSTRSNSSAYYLEHSHRHHNRILQITNFHNERSPFSSPKSSPSKERSPTRNVRHLPSHLNISPTRGSPPSSPRFTGPDSPRGGTPDCKERIKEISCISISPCGTWLAVGEKGHNPKVSLYKLTFNDDEAIEGHALSQELMLHTECVQCLAFSPCSRYLTSVGSMFDEVITCWGINKNDEWTRQATGRVKDDIVAAAWADSSTLFTIGKRHIKYWSWTRLEFGEIAVYKNRSVQYANLSGDHHFRLFEKVSVSRAIIVSAEGDIYDLDLCIKELKYSTHVSQQPAAIGPSGDSIYLACNRGLLKRLKIADFSISTDYDIDQGDVVALHIDENTLYIAGGFLGGIVEQDVANLASSEASKVEWEEQTGQSDILGLRACDTDSCMCWSTNTISMYNGTSLLWSVIPCHYADGIGEIRSVAYDVVNKIVVFSENGGALCAMRVSEECRGILWVDEDHMQLDQDCLSSSTDLDILQKGDGLMILSSSQDRQLNFDVWRVESDKTRSVCKPHAASINRVRFASSRQCISASLDNTICIFEVPESSGSLREERRIQLTRTHATDIDILECVKLVVTTSNRRINIYDINTGDMLSSFKATNESELTSLTFATTFSLDHAREKEQRILAIACSDKSIRLYSLENQALVATKYSHSGAISGLAWLSTETSAILLASTRNGCLISYKIEQSKDSRRMSSPLDSKSASPKRINIHNLGKSMKALDI